YDWSGYYAGAHVGGAWGPETWTLVDNPGDGESGSVGSAVTTHDIDGFFGGVQVGRNWQDGDRVWGVEAEISWADIDGSSARVSGGEKPGPRAWSSDMKWLATLGPRVGMAKDRNLFYVEGGLALANADYYHLGAYGGPPTPVPVGAERSYYGTDTNVGWFVGAGVERAVANNWSVRGEYNIIALGMRDQKLWGNPSEPAVFQVSPGMHTIKFSLNYLFR
ncbi:MAG: outer membrane beta-barrel protein, partial [Oricola sp.]